MNQSVLITALALAAVVSSTRGAAALGTTTAPAGPLSIQHGPNIYKVPAVDGVGNEYWAMSWSICPQNICAGNPAAAGNGFRTIPTHILGGSDRPKNGVAMGVTLPPGATVLAMTMRDHGDTVWPLNNVAAWRAAYPPTGISAGFLFDPAFAHELAQIQSAAMQGPAAQAFEIWTPGLGGFDVLPGFFDVWALVETPPGFPQTSLQGPYGPTGPLTGSIGLYFVDYASSTQNISIVHPAQDPGDPCTVNQPQILPFDLRGCTLAAGVGPGTPTGGAGFDMRIRENFVYPPLTRAGSTESPVTIALPAPVTPGYVVLLDDTAIGPDSVSNWSDVLAFVAPSPAAGPHVNFFSDPPGHPFTDADFAQYGLSTAQIRTGNTVFLDEHLPFVRYVAADPATGVAAIYRIHSDVDSLPPGAPLLDIENQFYVHESESDPAEPIVTVPLNMPVQPGFVVLLEDSLAGSSPEDTTRWSDLLYFPKTPIGTGSVVHLISDAPGSAANEQNLKSSDLAPLGITMLDVLESNTIYLRERPVNRYFANNPDFGNHTNSYYIISDMNEAAVPPGTGSLRLAISRVTPNPTRGATRIEFTTPAAGAVRLEIYDLGGRRVRTLIDEMLPAGARSETWDGLGGNGRALAAGAYLARLSAGGHTATRRIVLLR